MKYLMLTLFLFSCSKPKAPKLIENEPDEISEHRAYLNKLETVSKNNFLIPKEILRKIEESNLNQEEKSYASAKVQRLFALTKVQNEDQYIKILKNSYTIDSCNELQRIKERRILNTKKIKKIIEDKNFEKMKRIELFLGSKYFKRFREEFQSSSVIKKIYRDSCKK